MVANRNGGVGQLDRVDLFIPALVFLRMAANFRRGHRTSCRLDFEEAGKVVVDELLVEAVYANVYKKKEFGAARSATRYKHSEPPGSPGAAELPG